MRFSTFNNYKDPKPTGEIGMEEYLDRLKNPPQKAQILDVRLLKSRGSKYSTVKEKIGGCTVSGTFSYRSDKDLIQHSGLIALDFDDILREDIDDIKQKLTDDPYVFCYHDTVSGNLLVIIKINPKKHKASFNAACRYFYEEYSMVVDRAGSDVSRHRINSYDPTPYYNPQSRLFDQVVPDPAKAEPFKGTISNDRIRELVKTIEDSNIDLVSDYDSWIRVGYAIASQFKDSEEGLTLFHKISRIGSTYEENKCTAQYKYIVKSIQSGSKSSIGTLFYLAKESGIDISTESITVHEYIYSIIKPKYNIRYNELLYTFDLDGKQITRITINDIYMYVKKNCGEDRISKEDVETVIYSSLWPKYHPLKDYFANLDPWDGVDHIETLCSSLGLDICDFDRSYNYLKKWLVGVVACLHGKDNPLILVLVGSLVGAGKTSFVRNILPKELSDYCAEAELDNNAMYNTMCQNLIVFDDEFSNKKNVEAKMLKKLTSKSKYTVTRKYEANQTVMIRIASLCGTCNDLDIIKDEHTNRRILPIHVIKPCNWEIYDSVDRNQLMSQMMHLFTSGFNYQIVEQSLIQELEEYSEEFRIGSKENELLSRYFRPGSEFDSNVLYLTATDIMIEIEAKSGMRNLNRDAIGKALKRLGYQQKIFRRERKLGRYYLVEPHNLKDIIQNNISYSRIPPSEAAPF